MRGPDADQHGNEPSKGAKIDVRLALLSNPLTIAGGTRLEAETHADRSQQLQLEEEVRWSMKWLRMPGRARAPALMPAS